jgi:arylsulfatase A-like enzyme
MPANHLRYPDLLELLEVPDKQTGTLAIKREFQDIVVRAKDRMIRHGRWKLTYQPLKDGARYALFDLERDPDCLRDVAAQHPEILADLEARLLRWLGSERSAHRFTPKRTGVPGLAHDLRP